MKVVKKGMAILFAALLLCAVSVGALAEGEPFSVSLRIEGAEKTLFHDTVTLSAAEDVTVLDVIQAADSASEELEVTVTESEYGSYISAVNGEAEGQILYDGWSYLKNGTAPEVGVSACSVANGDTVVLYYADPFGENGFQIPKMDDSRLAEGILKFTSADTVYDENWQPTTVVNPVVGATVTWSYAGGIAQYVTDEKGEIKIAFAQLTAGDHAVQIEKYAQSVTVSGGKLPLVLRLSADTKVTVPQITGSSQTETSSEEQTVSAPNGTENDSFTSPKTGSESTLAVALSMVGICAVALFVTYKRVKA